MVSQAEHRGQCVGARTAQEGEKGGDGGQFGTRRGITELAGEEPKGPTDLTPTGKVGPVTTTTATRAGIARLCDHASLSPPCHNSWERYGARVRRREGNASRLPVPAASGTKTILAPLSIRFGFFLDLRRGEPVDPRAAQVLFPDLRCRATGVPRVPVKRCRTETPAAALVTALPVALRGVAPVNTLAVFAAPRGEARAHGGIKFQVSATFAPIPKEASADGLAVAGVAQPWGRDRRGLREESGRGRQGGGRGCLLQHAGGFITLR